MTRVPAFTTRRRSLRFRCSALVWAVAFVLAGVRPAFAEVECAHHAGHHDASAPAAGASGSGHAAHAEASGPAGSGAVGGHVHGAHDPATDAHGDLCTCIGPCHAGTVLLLPSASIDAPRVAEAPHHAAGQPVDLESLPGRTAFVLPFATAPPQGC